MFTSLLSQAAKLSIIPASLGPWAAVLVPVLIYVATQRDIKMSVH